MATRWFVIIAVAAIIILAALLLVVSLHRTTQGLKITDRLFLDNAVFLDYAEKGGLSARECQLLLDIATKAGLEQSSAIFTMDNAFDRGAARMIRESLARQQGTDEAKQLRSELSFLREKLGFQKRRTSSIGSPRRAKKLSSRQIPVDSKIHMTRRKTRDSGDIEVTVIKNDDMELIVKSAMPVKIAPGEFWRVRYYFGASVWEFDTSVVGCDGDMLVLNHSDDVRFINRRRFLRVPVNKQAYVAHFPFARTRPPDGEADKKDAEAKQGLSDACGGCWGPPEFVPAVVTELAGPGLRIEVPMEVKVGDRMLVVLRLDEEENKGSAAPGQDSKPAAPRIVEDIGEVRHTKSVQNGLSIAVELTGLSDSNVNELIRATNLASLKASAESQGVGGSVKLEEGATEPAAVQGI
jgi:hypothetical protein